MKITSLYPFLRLDLIRRGFILQNNTKTTAEYSKLYTGGFC